MVHYHGTPLTPRWALHKLRGRSFCVPFSDPGDLEVAMEIGESVMLDNGAYSFWRKGVKTDWPAFYAWCEPWLERWTTWAVIPDVIDGDEKDNDQLVEEWPFGQRGSPVWHPHESLARLRGLVEEFDLVCIGGSPTYELGKPAWKARMADAMDVACDEHGIPYTRLHLLRGLAYSKGPYPLYSADSVTIARSHLGDNSGTARKDPVRMATDVDSRQPPSRWHRGQGEQGGLFDAYTESDKYVVENHPHSPKRGFNQLGFDEESA